MSEEVVPAGAATLPVTEVAKVREGMFGVSGSGDTSGFGGLVSVVPMPVAAVRPFGGYFDVIADELAASLVDFGSSYDKAVDKVVVANGELTFYVHASELRSFVQCLRDEPGLRFEMSLGVSGVHYPTHVGSELHAVYHFKSITHNRRIRVETTASDSHPHLPSIMDIYPTCDWHERETYDMFGIIFDGHPHLTRILMPDDWEGHPQRKDYPLGGIAVEYKGASTPAPDQRRSYN
jgi:NADH-quinone oxidoreductase subunit C